MTNHGTFVWNELDTPDQGASGTFFGALLGWTRKEIDAGPFGIYSLFQQQGRDADEDHTSSAPLHER